MWPSGSEPADPGRDLKVARAGRPRAGRALLPAFAAALTLTLAPAVRAQEPPVEELPVEEQPPQLTAEEKQEALAIYVGVRNRLARTFLPGLLDRPRPQLLFRDTAPGGAVHGAILGRDVVALPPLQQRLVSRDPDLVRRAKHVLIHELAHLEQRGNLWPDTPGFSWPAWKREGGARAFAKIVCKRWYGYPYLSGARPEYEHYATTVLETLGRRWVMRGQFRKR